MKIKSVKKVARPQVANQVKAQAQAPPQSQAPPKSQPPAQVPVIKVNKPGPTM